MKIKKKFNDIKKKASKKLKPLTSKYTPSFFYDLINKKIPLDKYVKLIKKYLIVAQKYADTAFENKLYATYLPFIGWLIPFHFNKDDKFAMHHGRQAFLISVSFAAALIFIYFATYLIPVKIKAAKLFLIILIYLIELLYLAIFIIGTRWIIKQEKKSLPFIDKYDHLINI